MPEYYRDCGPCSRAAAFDEYETCCSDINNNDGPDIKVQTSLYCCSAAGGAKKRVAGAKGKAAAKPAPAASSTTVDMQTSQGPADSQEAGSSAPAKELSLMERLAGAKKLTLPTLHLKALFSDVIAMRNL